MCLATRPPPLPCEKRSGRRRQPLARLSSVKGPPLPRRRMLWTDRYQKGARMLKIVFVGAGWFAIHVHGPALAHYAREHPGEVDLAAVCVRKSVDKAEAFCRDFGFQRVYTDLEEMLDKEKPGACWGGRPVEAIGRR